jgi:hypothetical protein
MSLAQPPDAIETGRDEQRRGYWAGKVLARRASQISAAGVVHRSG